jgi:glycosyltransferase involved in cell wall biosynthesis
MRAGDRERRADDLFQTRHRTTLAESTSEGSIAEKEASGGGRATGPFPGICAVIPAHNSQATLARALDSVRVQTQPVSQIVVVDDASTDATGEVARNYPGLNVEVVRLDKNVGAAAARNRGVTAARTELVAFLDADDEWLPTKLEKQVAVITSNNKVTYVSCGSDLISPQGVNTGDIYRGQRVVAGNLAWKALLWDNYVTTPSVLVWRDALLKAGGFDQGLKIAEDQDMWIRLAENGELGYVRESLVHVHERQSSLSAGSFSDQLAYTLPMIEGHITRLASKLSQREINNIRGRRLLRLGQLACHRGASKVGRSLILRSILLGHKPWEGLLFLATTNPLALWLKQVLLRR